MNLPTLNLFGRILAAFGVRPRSWGQLYARNAWFASNLAGRRASMLASVARNLRRKIEANEFPHDDDIFSPFTTLVEFSRQFGLPTLVTASWPELDAILTNAETALRAARANPTAYIHKGSPYFNIALCHFAAGDLESGFKFLAMTGDEHARSGSSQFPVLLGDHVLSRQFLIAPVATALLPGWAARYQEITARVLDEAELVAIIKRAALRPTDGIQLLLSLHRLLKTRGTVQNDWTRYLRTRALAEMLVALESMLRRIQAAHQGEMSSQFTHMFGGRPAYNQPFLTFQNNFNAIYKPPGGADTTRTPAAVDWSVNEAVARLAAAPNREAKAGIASYAAVRMRNTLLHVLENQIQLYADDAKCIDMFGVSLAVFRIAMFAEDGAL